MDLDWRPLSPVARFRAKKLALNGELSDQIIGYQMEGQDMFEALKRLLGIGNQQKPEPGAVPAASSVPERPTPIHATTSHRPVKQPSPLAPAPARIPTPQDPPRPSEPGSISSVVLPMPPSLPKAESPDPGSKPGTAILYPVQSKFAVDSRTQGHSPDPLPDGKYVVSFANQRHQGETLTVQLEILCGPYCGRIVPLIFEGNIVRKAMRELATIDYEALAIFGNAKASALQSMVCNLGQFFVTVKDGVVRSIPDSCEHSDKIERLLNQQTFRPGAGLHQPRFAELIDLAIRYQIPLDLEIRGGSRKKEFMVPVEWEGETLVLKRFPEDWDHEGALPLRGKSSRVGAGEISDIDVSDADFPDSIVPFVSALARSENARNREIAVLHVQCLDVEPGDNYALPILQDLAHDPDRNVRARVAQSMGPMVPSTGRKVGKQSFRWRVTDPTILALATELAKDAERDVRKQACYPLGYCTWSSAQAVLERMKAQDPADDVRHTANLALERMAREEQTKVACEAAEVELALNPPQPKARGRNATTIGS